MVKFNELKIGDKLILLSDTHRILYVVSKELHKDYNDYNTILLNNLYTTYKNVPYKTEWNDERRLERHP
jgi:hypothetical protein